MLAIMDDRTCSHFLSLTAFSAITQCAHWVVSYMVSQLQDKPKAKKPKAWWSHNKEVAFLNYLVEHQSEATHGCFKSSTISGAINSITHLYERGSIKNKTSRINKWNLVHFSLPFCLFTDHLYLVEISLYCNSRIQDISIWCNLGWCSWHKHQQ